MRYRTVLGFTIALAVVALPALAQDASGSSARKAPANLDAATGKALNAAIAALDAARLSPYERSKAEQVRFNLAFATGQIAEARAHLTVAIDAGGLNAQEVEQARFQMAQSYMAEQRWQEGAASLEQWVASVPNPNSAAYYLLAVAYYQMGEHDRALAPAQRAVDSSDAPLESWVQLLLAVRLQRKEFEDAARLLQRLIVLAPAKKTYWMQLSAVYGQLGDYPGALATLQLAYDSGLLTEDADIRRYVDLLVFNDLPFRGARVLEDAIERQAVSSVDAAVYEKLANCWIAAREFERAVAPLQRAGELSSSGEPFARLAEVQVQRDDWPAAEVAARRALDKGGLRDAASVQLLLGMALLNQQRLDEARRWFEQAERSPAHRDAARAYFDSITPRYSTPLRRD
jgi:tetratricopeptide (TPR) repeat protein